VANAVVDQDCTHGWIRGGYSHALAYTRGVGLRVLLMLLPMSSADVLVVLYVHECTEMLSALSLHCVVPFRNCMRMMALFVTGDILAK
jgi:hypothetical protein